MANKEYEKAYTWLKLRQIKHKLTYKDYDPIMKSAMERYKICEDKKPASQIREEIALCNKYWGCYPLHYFRYDLYKKDKELTKEELINYVPEFLFYNLFLPYYSGYQYSVLLKDKNIMEQLFRSSDIKQPHTICKLINGRLYSSDLKAKSFYEVYCELKEKQYEKIFVKPVDGEGGYGIVIFHLNEDNKYINDNVEFNEKFLIDIGKNNNYIIQKGINQQEGISKLYPNSVNTFRIATENIKGKARVVCSVLRIGKGGNEVDNASQNGIVLGIDSDTGKCMDYACTERREIFYEHPDTGFIFKNHEIEDWSSIKRFAVEGAQKLPQFTYLGWDIALTEDGPLAIETNLDFGLDLYQVAIGGLREAFNITEPKKYWKDRGKNFG